MRRPANAKGQSDGPQGLMLISSVQESEETPTSKGKAVGCKRTGGARFSVKSAQRRRRILPRNVHFELG